MPEFIVGEFLGVNSSLAGNFRAARKAAGPGQGRFGRQVFAGDCNKVSPAASMLGNGSGFALSAALVRHRGPRSADIDYDTVFWRLTRSARSGAQAQNDIRE
jgi:hypothetical protein